MGTPLDTPGPRRISVPRLPGFRSMGHEANPEGYPPWRAQGWIAGRPLVQGIAVWADRDFIGSRFRGSAVPGLA